jgi:hypothetical protein
VKEVHGRPHLFQLRLSRFHWSSLHLYNSFIVGLTVYIYIYQYIIMIHESSSYTYIYIYNHNYHHNNNNHHHHHDEQWCIMNYHKLLWFTGPPTPSLPRVSGLCTHLSDISATRGTRQNQMVECCMETKCDSFFLNATKTI